MRGRFRRNSIRLSLLGILVSGVFLTLFAGFGAASSPPCPTTPGAQSCTYSFTGGEQSFTVPAGVTSIHVVSQGGGGGVGDCASSTCSGFFGSGGAAGKGAQVSADLSVTPGQTLYVEVGGAANTGGRICNVACAPVGGFNGGGNGDPNNNSGGGGGASDLRTTARADAGTLDSRLLVAAGGGGGGGGGEDFHGEGLGQGGTGGNAASPGGDGTGCGLPPSTGGGAGGTNTGGAAGNPSGTQGSKGTGGSDGGGGGGGGYYGGGSGGAQGLLSECLTGAGGGGGGSNNTTDPNAVITNDANSGDGEITISYAVPAPSIAAPGLDKTATATHHRKVEWSISKRVDGKTSESFNQATAQTLHYSVALTKTVDYDTYSVTGDITASNTNSDPLPVTISETGLAPAVSGSSCTLDLTGNPTSVDVTLDAGSVSTPGTYTVSYTCTFTTAPGPTTQYVNGASVTYGTGSGTGEVDALSDLFTFPAATEDGAPDSVTIADPNAPAAAGFPKTPSDSTTYTYTQSVFSDPCTQFNNTATIVDTGQSSSTSVAFCGPKGLLNNLLSYVNGLPPGTSLPSKVQTAINYYNAGDIRDTCTALTGVINQAKAQSGKKITKTQANTVIAMARQIQAVLGC